MALEQFKRGDLVTVRHINRTLQVYHVKQVDGQVLCDCRPVPGASTEGGMYRPEELIHCIGLKAVLSPSDDD